MTYRILLLIFLCGSIGIRTTAQPALAKLKYEEAEKAYQAGNYYQTFDLLNEVEAIIKATSPKTMYLRILAAEKLEVEQFSILDALRQLCTFYLNNYGSIEEYEDQYREVYEIKRKLDRYPQTAEAFNMAKYKEAQIAETRNRALALEAKMATFRKAPVKLGMKRSDIPNSIMAAFEPGTISSSNKEKSYNRKYENDQFAGVSYLNFDSQDNLIGYIYIISSVREEYRSDQIKKYQSMEDVFFSSFKVDNATQTKNVNDYVETIKYETNEEEIYKYNYTTKSNSLFGISIYPKRNSKDQKATYLALEMDKNTQFVGRKLTPQYHYRIIERSGYR